MSSVVISGDTSGAITLSAPAVAGSNAVTLPAATGELSMLGATGQTYQDVTGSRTSTTTYTNSTGKPIFVSVFSTTSSLSLLIVTVSGSIIQNVRTNVGAGTETVTVAFIVPPSATYSVDATTSAISKWFELR
ncbi:hypothetical protein UFOVP135_23 [uncultured Caudovirales phage]|uniref:Uncharacterized protein n=1 Tax=uncultured Caudovirales phage TaxID=2100421 RepID=A0A6J5LJX9_9CAUD|nr:hypothetical protein UFOVP135_23 [uncultured Caudovirales phage]